MNCVKSSRCNKKVNPRTPTKCFKINIKTVMVAQVDQNRNLHFQKSAAYLKAQFGFMQLCKTVITCRWGSQQITCCQSLVLVRDYIMLTLHPKKVFY